MHASQQGMLPPCPQSKEGDQAGRHPERGATREALGREAFPWAATEPVLRSALPPKHVLPQVTGRDQEHCSPEITNDRKPRTWRDSRQSWGSEEETQFKGGKGKFTGMGQACQQRRRGLRTNAAGAGAGAGALGAQPSGPRGCGLN